MLSWLEQCGPVTAVRGNVDDSEDALSLPETQLLELGGWKILVLHVYGMPPKGQDTPHDYSILQLGLGLSVVIMLAVVSLFLSFLQCPKTLPSAAQNATRTLWCAGTATGICLQKMAICGSLIQGLRVRLDLS